MKALRLERKKMVKGGHPKNTARWELQFVSDKQQQVVFKIAKEFLGLVENFNQGIVTKLVFFHVHFKDLEALVATGVLHHARECLFFSLWN
jgi:hypothetical protein